MTCSRRLFMTASASTAAALTLAACSGSTSSSKASSKASAASSAGPVTIESNTGSVTVNLPVSRPACLDNRSFEILADWGVKLVAAPKDLIPSTVTAFNGEDVVDIGNHREPDLEALVAAEPDLIISGQRFSQHDEQIASLSQGTALVDLEPREDHTFDEELIRHATGLGQLFSKEAEADKLVEDFKAAAERAKKAYDGTSTVLAVNIAADEAGYTPAKDVIESNAVLHNVDAVASGHVVYAPQDTYTNESIITYTEIFTAIAQAFETGTGNGE